MAGDANKVKRARLIKEWYKRMVDYDSTRRLIESTFMCSPESPFYDMLDRMAQEYTYTLEQLIGDDEHWLSWFLYDNDLGRSGLMAKSHRLTKSNKVDTVDKLIKFIDSVYEAV